MGEARAAACPRRCGGELGAGGICTTLLDIPHSSHRLEASIYQCSVSNRPQDAAQYSISRSITPSFTP